MALDPAVVAPETEIAVAELMGSLFAAWESGDMQGCYALAQPSWKEFVRDGVLEDLRLAKEAVYRYGPFAVHRPTKRLYTEILTAAEERAKDPKPAFALMTRNLDAWRPDGEPADVETIALPGLNAENIVDARVLTVAKPKIVIPDGKGGFKEFWGEPESKTFLIRCIREQGAWSWNPVSILRSVSRAG